MITVNVNSVNLMNSITKLLTLGTITKLSFTLACIATALFFLLMWWANTAAQTAGKKILYNDVIELKHHTKNQDRIALVFGCAATINNRTNLYFKYRIEAAHALWKAGATKGFIVSGDNSRDDYNEPADMKQALIDKGVPADKIICDYAGLRTLDSIVRAKEIFGAHKIILVSQKFHNERAAYIAKKRNIDAVGYNAPDVIGREKQKREYLARIRMWVDENILSTKPKHLGSKEIINF